MTMAPANQHNYVAWWKGASALLRHPEVRLWYSRPADVLYLSVGPLVPGVVYEPAGPLALRVANETGQVVAIEIHNFKSSYLKHDRTLEAAWKQQHSLPARVIWTVRERMQRFFISQILQDMERYRRD